MSNDTRPDARDIEMMKTPDDWPAWPLLPLKRPNKAYGTSFAYMFAEGKPRIYRGSMWKPDPTKDPCVEFDSFEAIAADGWMVD
jgi:hypothetical protein